MHFVSTRVSHSRGPFPLAVFLAATTLIAVIFFSLSVTVKPITQTFTFTATEPLVIQTAACKIGVEEGSLLGCVVLASSACCGHQLPHGLTAPLPFAPLSPLILAHSSFSDPLSAAPMKSPSVSSVTRAQCPPQPTHSTRACAPSPPPPQLAPPPHLHILLFLNFLPPPPLSGPSQSEDRCSILVHLPTTRTSPKSITFVGTRGESALSENRLLIGDRTSINLAGSDLTIRGHYRYVHSRNLAVAGLTVDLDQGEISMELLSFTAAASLATDYGSVSLSSLTSVYINYTAPSANQTVCFSSPVLPTVATLVDCLASPSLDCMSLATLRQGVAAPTQTIQAAVVTGGVYGTVLDAAGLVVTTTDTYPAAPPDPAVNGTDRETMVTVRSMALDPLSASHWPHTA